MKDMYTSDSNEDIGFSKLDPETNKPRKTTPKYFTTSKKETNQLSKNLNKVGLTWLKAVMEYENRKDLEFEFLTLLKIEENKKALQIDEKTNGVIRDGSNDLATKDSDVNFNIAQINVFSFIYGTSEDPNSLGNSIINMEVAQIGSGENTEEKAISIKKGIKTAEAYVRMTAVGLKPLTMFRNFIGGKMNAFINAGSHYTGKEFEINSNKVMVPFDKGLSFIQKAIIHRLIPLSGEDISVVKERQLSKGQSMFAFLNSWTIQDIAMIGNSYFDKRLEFANAATIIDNTIVINGKLINIRQYLAKQDRDIRKTLSESERLDLEKTFENRVKELKESDKALKNIAVFDKDTDTLSIPGISIDEESKFRTVMIELARNITGQMSSEDVMGFRFDTIFRSFMMFKGWIPKLASVRFKNITHNNITEEWEYGRYKAFYTAWSAMGKFNINNVRNIIIGNDKGLALMTKMYEDKKEQYRKEHGKELEITEEEFQDLIRQHVKNMIKEIHFLLGLMVLVIGAAMLAPDDDEDKLTKNRYKYAVKAINDMRDELWFFINPLSADEMTKGSIFPALGILRRVGDIFSSFIKEGFYEATGNEKKVEKNNALKPLISAVPPVSQIFSEIMVNYFPEIAEDYGYRVVIDNRR